MVFLKKFLTTEYKLFEFIEIPDIAMSVGEEDDVENLGEGQEKAPKSRRAGRHLSLSNLLSVLNQFN